MIEKDERGGVTVTTNGEELSVEAALLMIRLAEMNILSYYLSGQTTSQAIEDQP